MKGFSKSPNQINSTQKRPGLSAQESGAPEGIPIQLIIKIKKVSLYIEILSLSKQF
jgi:hypothetical protein